MVQLADANGEVARVAERLRQADVVGNRLPEDLGILVDARAVWVQAGEERVPARPAQRKGAVGAVKTDAARGSP
jgi:hypothetical protein